MSISSISRSISNSITRVSNAVIQRTASVIPSMTVSNPKTLDRLTWIGEKISSPENRLILGVSALMSQPFIDLHNRKVDEDTRKVSAARTVAKIIAGTLTGVIVRSACIKSINAFTHLPSTITPDMKFKKLRSLFVPSPGIVNNLELYKKSLGTILSLFVMLFTNFLIDAPLTKFLTNKFVDRINEKKAAQNSTANKTPVQSSHSKPTPAVKMKGAEHE